MLTAAGDYYRIACFLYNEFGKRLNMENEKTELIVERMKSANLEVNALAEFVSSHNYDMKRVPFQSVSSTEILDFPELTLEDLEVFFTGSYQLSQMISYLGEMLEDDNTLNLKFIKEAPNIIRFDVKSRHISAKTYKCYVKYNTESVGIEAIEGYCCNCANGLRTICCCSHIASLIYYLSYGRYLSRIVKPAEMLSHIFDVDNICPVIYEDSDDD